MSIHFLLNDREVISELPKGTLLLDFIRQDQGLTGTKIGCREGDCGACTVLIGDSSNDQLRYRSMTSCLMPLGNAHGKHIVTIEGLNLEDLNPVQQAIVEEGGTQCGFCTVGFVVSLAGFCMDPARPSPAKAVAAMDGNICRCTGYKSLERAGARIATALADRDDADPFAWLLQERFLPAWFAEIPSRLQRLNQHSRRPPLGKQQIIAGGTDLMVQCPEAMQDLDLDLVFDRPEHCGISEDEGRIRLGSAVTAADLLHSPLLNRHFPQLPSYLKLVSSTPIRNMGTIGGNLVNASPIGDLTIFFLALDAQVHLSGNDREWAVSLKDFYQGYKKLKMAAGSQVIAISFNSPGPQTHFNFEKVSKRTHLDIASVNSAASFTMDQERIKRAHLSAGGVAPIPLYLAQTSAFLAGKMLSAQVLEQAAQLAVSESAPISDARGSATYKQLLLRQLIYAHVLKLFPELSVEVPQ